MRVTSRGFCNGKPLQGACKEFVEAIWTVVGRCDLEVYPEEQKLNLQYDGDRITYHVLKELSYHLGSTHIDIDHQSGGPYSEVTPDLRPGEFTLYCKKVDFSGMDWEEYK